MPRDGSGGYTRVTPGTPYVSNTTTSSTVVNSEMDDLGAEIANSLAADGQKAPTNNLPMGGYKHTGVGNASARNHYAAAGQVQDGTVTAATIGGTANALTFTLSPAPTAYAANMRWQGVATATCSAGATTGNLNTIGDRSIKRPDLTDPLENDIVSGQLYQFAYDGTYIILLNPSRVVTQSAGDNSTNPASTAYVDSTVQQFVTGRLAISGGNLVLSPYNGNRISVNGAVLTIPGAGVSLSAVGTTSNTTYYIYAYNNSGTLTLEFSATAYATDATTGLTIKSGDATRTLVGIARTDGTPSWSLCRSWINDPGFTAQNAITSDATTSSTSYVEVSSGLRTAFLAWAGEVVNVYAGGRISGAACSLAFDGTTAVDITGADTGNSGERGSVGISYATQALAEGYHYATMLFKDIGFSGCTVYGEAFTGNRGTVQVVIGRR